MVQLKETQRRQANYQNFNTSYVVVQLHQKSLINGGLVHFNTSYVVVQHDGTVIIVHADGISIHLMLWFNQLDDAEG